MKQNEQKALDLFRYHTGGTFEVYRLIGDACRNRRVVILSALAGEPVPQRKAGINALRVAMWSLYNGIYTCPADHEQKFIAWAKDQFEYPTDNTMFYCHTCDEDYELPEDTEECVICGSPWL